MRPDIPTLSCLVLAEQDEHHKLVSGWLGVSTRVGSVTAVRNEESLRTQLCSGGRCDLCIIVVESREQTLPACIIRYPTMRLLVLSVSRKLGKLSSWLQQGATDAVSLQKPAAAQHAISRLIDECSASLTHDQLNAHIAQLEQEIADLKSLLKGESRSFTLTASNDAQHSAAKQVEADLNCMESPVMTHIAAKQKTHDSTTGQSTRTTVMNRFQKLLQSEIKAPRFTALLVRILSDKTQAEFVNDEGTDQELTLNRAADALQKGMEQGTILGRVNQNALLLIQSSDIEPASRDAANRVRKTLGSLGGLIDSEKDVRINTMTLPAKTRISVDEVVARLEAH